MADPTLRPEFKCEYQRLGDGRWFLGEIGSEEECRNRANSLWADQTTDAVRIIRYTPEVIAEKRRAKQ